MPHSTTEPPTSIEVDLKYMPPLAPGQPERMFTTSTGYRRSMEKTYESHKTTVTNMRGHEDEFSLDIQGFQLVKDNPISEEVAKLEREKFMEIVYPQTKELLKRLVGASHVHVFSHVVRNEPHQKILDILPDTSVPDEEECKIQSPAMVCHIDQSYHGAEQVVNDVPEADELAPKTKTRWGIINVWKPLKPVTREPLAVCDARSTPDKDLQQVFMHVKRPPRKATDADFIDVGLYYLQHGEGHKWYWPSEMQPDEALLIKCFDTKKDGRARRAAHSAMITPQDHGPTRESVEIRCLVFWQDQELE